MLFGGDGATGTEVSDATPQSKVGEIALVLSYRQLFGDGGSGTVDPARLSNAVRCSSRQVRDAILNMAQDLRRETWSADKHRMARTIPVFEALVQADPKWHVPYGNLGYALKDAYVPDYKRALENLNHAVELRGDRFDEGAFYQYSRVLCLMNWMRNSWPGSRPIPKFAASSWKRSARHAGKWARCGIGIRLWRIRTRRMSGRGWS